WTTHGVSSRIHVFLCDFRTFCVPLFRRERFVFFLCQSHLVTSDYDAGRPDSRVLAFLDIRYRITHFQDTAYFFDPERLYVAEDHIRIRTAFLTCRIRAEPYVRLISFLLCRRNDDLHHLVIISCGG